MAAEYDLREHSFAVYDRKMNLLKSSKEDLFGIIRQMDPFVVDNNSEWKLRSLAEPTRAFLLGRTIDLESPNPEGVYFNPKVQGGRRNVFLVGLEARTDGLCFVIHRLDHHFKAVFKGPIESTDSLNPTEKEQRNNSLSRLTTRDAILKTHIPLQMEELKSKIFNNRPFCFCNYDTSALTANLGYALLLKESQRSNPKEFQKFMNNDKNVFGDTALVQESLFLDARILSNDKHVRKIASYCGIECVS